MTACEIQFGSGKNMNLPAKKPPNAFSPSLLNSGLQDGQESIPKSSAQSESFANLVLTSLTDLK